MANYDFPTEVITLPSQGNCYSEDNPLSKGTVEIKYMTAKEEEILASQNLIRKGVVLDKLFESIIVDKDVNIDDILIGDKNAIMLAARILGYGAEYPIEIEDGLGEKEEVTIDLSKIQTISFSRHLLYNLDLSKLKYLLFFQLVTDQCKITNIINLNLSTYEEPGLYLLNDQKIYFLAYLEVSTRDNKKLSVRPYLQKFSPFHIVKDALNIRAKVIWQSSNELLK
jgi:hypothetical protein